MISEKVEPFQILSIFERIEKFSINPLNQKVSSSYNQTSFKRSDILEKFSQTKGFNLSYFIVFFENSKLYLYKSYLRFHGNLNSNILSRRLQGTTSKQKHMESYLMSGFQFQLEEGNPPRLNKIHKPEG